MTVKGKNMYTNTLPELQSNILWENNETREVEVDKWRSGKRTLDP